jgi:hypothetical protein
MNRYSEGAWERAMKVQDVILRAMAKRITWGQAGEIIGVTYTIRRDSYFPFGPAGLKGITSSVRTTLSFVMLISLLPVSNPPG